MKSPLKTATATLVGSLLTVVALQAAASPVVIYLPTGPVDGLGPQQYDQGLAFSAALLEQQRAAGLMPGNPTTDFQPAAGSGTAGVLVYSGSGTNTYNTTFGFASSLPTNNTAVDGTWGGGTVGGMRNYLNSLTSVANSLQPLFVFDHNENNSGSNLRVTANVIVGGQSFSFDSTANNTFLATDYVTSCGTVSIGPAPNATASCPIPFPTTSGTTYSWGSNGQGNFDYYALFTGLDIWSNSYTASDLFKVEFHLRDLDAGFEELAIGGYNFYTAQPPINVPEPGSIALVGLGLCALSLVSRRRVKKFD